MGRVTKIDAMEEIRRIMAAGYRLPGEATVEGMAGIWAEVLEWVETEDLRAAVRRFLADEERYWPKPGEIRRRSTEARARRMSGGQMGGDLSVEYRQWEQHQEGPCPVCGAVLQLTSRGASDVIWDAKVGRLRPRTDADPPPARRFGVVHDREEHRRRGVPTVTASVAAPPAPAQITQQERST